MNLTEWNSASLRAAHRPLRKITLLNFVDWRIRTGLVLYLNLYPMRTHPPNARLVLLLVGIKDQTEYSNLNSNLSYGSA